jgi:hypothetical protein
MEDSSPELILESGLVLKSGEPGNSVLEYRKVELGLVLEYCRVVLLLGLDL